MSPGVLALLLLAAGQAPASFGSGVTAVYVDAFVRDEGGGPVSGLTAADFALTDDGVPQDIELMAVESVPLMTVLVLDTSDSIDDTKLRHLQAAGRTFLAGLRPGDETALVGFNEEVQLRVPSTQDALLVTRGLNGVLPRGGTALYDGLYVSLALGATRGRSLVVLFTDGEDTISWLDPLQVAQVVEESNVLLQVVATTQSSAAQRESASSYRRLLREFAQATGGELWEAESAKLASAFQPILDAMKTRYVLRFEPRDKRPGLHRLAVKLTHRRAKLQCRKTYFVAP